MTRSILLAAALLAFVGCQKDRYYVEGRVKTIGATGVTQTSALLHGNLTLRERGEGLEVLKTGFVLRKDGSVAHEFYAPNSVSDGDFTAYATDLFPDTKYQLQACVEVQYKYYDDGTCTTTQTFYGNTIELTTKPEVSPTPRH